MCPAGSRRGSASYYSCPLPNFDFDPSVPYDVEVSTNAGIRNFSGLVQYTAAPTLASINQCIDRGDSYSPLLGCAVC